MTVALLGVENPFLASFDPPFSAEERPATGSDLLKEGLDNFAQAERRVQSLLRVQDFNAGRHCLSANYLIYGFIYLSSRYLLRCLQICLTIRICFLHVYNPSGRACRPPSPYVKPEPLETLKPKSGSPMKAPSLEPWPMP